LDYKNLKHEKKTVRQKYNQHVAIFTMQKSLRGHDRSYWSACFLQIILYQII